LYLLLNYTNMNAGDITCCRITVFLVTAYCRLALALVAGRSTAVRNILLMLEERYVIFSCHCGCMKHIFCGVRRFKWSLCPMLFRYLRLHRQNEYSN